MWDTMSRLYHPQWTRSNGEVGGNTFQDWTRELLPYGSNGVLQGLQEVRSSGNVYVPPLAKFLSMCRGGGEAHTGEGSFGEWEVCPYTNRRRRIKKGFNQDHEDAYRVLAAREGSKDDQRSGEEIRQSI